MQGCIGFPLSIKMEVEAARALTSLYWQKGQVFALLRKGIKEVLDDVVLLKARRYPTADVNELQQILEELDAIDRDIITIVGKENVPPDYFSVEKAMDRLMKTVGDCLARVLHQLATADVEFC